MPPFMELGATCALPNAVDAGAAKAGLVASAKAINPPANVSLPKFLIYNCSLIILQINSPRVIQNGL